MDMTWLFTAAGAIALIGLGIFGILLAMLFRVVVKTNEVHVVQRRGQTTPYGRGYKSNVYYRWPRWVPHFGLTVIELPVSNFDLALTSYEAYDQDRVPFICDVVAFFRVEDPAKAAQRVSSMTELKDQLTQIIQGAVRKVLASDIIDEIMLKRAKFGDAFTTEVGNTLNEWGVGNVKSMELMDIRDPHDDSTRNVQNIMLRKSSEIERITRSEVAINKRDAEQAEIDAQRDVDVRQQEATQAVGERTAEQEKMVGIADEHAKQEVLSEMRETKERDMQVVRVEQVRAAEIKKDQEIVAAEEDKQTRIIKAEGDKQQTIVRAEGDKQEVVLAAEGHLTQEQKRAQGIQAVGVSEGMAIKAKNMGDVDPQIVLAQEIGENEGYQRYLVSIENIKAYIQVGSANAKALEDADIKVIANTDAEDGLNSIGDILTAKGGQKLGSMLEGLVQTPVGEAVVEKVVGTNNAGHQGH